jgi:threonine synthase
VSALAVDGSFDDCQQLVKAALGDAELLKRLALSSANSINVSRLIPQAVYYAAAAGRAFAGLTDPDGEATPRVRDAAAVSGAASRKVRKGEAITLVVPSGNFGNLTAGLYAWKMGAPIKRFVAATNINKTVPDYLESGDYLARPSQATISNAMDVGAPSNFERMAAHLSWDEMKAAIVGIAVSDEQTRETIRQVYSSAGYLLDPHSSVAWTAADKALGRIGSGPLAILSTAHPAKFAEIVEPITTKISVPPSLVKAMERKPESRSIPADISVFKDSLL